MNMPWERDPETVPDAVTGLYPGQRHPLDIPDFIRTFRASLNREASLPKTAPTWVPPWCSTS